MQTLGNGYVSLTSTCDRLPASDGAAVAATVLNFGDSATAPVMIQNQSAGSVAVQIAARSSNLRIAGSRGFSVSLAEGQRTKVYFELAADDQVGTRRRG